MIVTDTTQTPDDEVNIPGDATIEGSPSSYERPAHPPTPANARCRTAQLTVRRNVFVQTPAPRLPLYVYWNEDPQSAGRAIANLLHDHGRQGTSDAAAIFALCRPATRRSN
jgi:hypothetical protein